MDRRQQKTRAAIFRAFTELLGKESYSSITVQEILDAANIGRSTFYAHFETKDALLYALSEDIFSHVFSETLSSERTHDFSTRERAFADEITHMLYHLQDNRDTIRKILNGDGGELFLRFFKASLSRAFEKELAKHPSDLPKDYLLHHLVCDFAETVRWWMQNERYTPEQVSGFFLRSNPLA